MFSGAAPSLRATLKYAVNNWGPVIFEPILDDRGNEVVYFNELHNVIETWDGVVYSIYDENNNLVLSG